MRLSIQSQSTENMFALLHTQDAGNVFRDMECSFNKSDMTCGLLFRLYRTATSTNQQQHPTRHMLRVAKGLHRRNWHTQLRRFRLPQTRKYGWILWGPLLGLHGTLTSVRLLVPAFKSRVQHTEPISSELCSFCTQHNHRLRNI